MKYIFTFILVFLGMNLCAQTPQAIKYQAVVRDGAGNVLSDRVVSFSISILHGSASGTTAYSETHSKTTNAFGLVDLDIGNGAPVSGSFTGISWGSDVYFVKVEMDPNGGTSYQWMGTGQLLSVPYALYAKDVQNNNDADADPVNELQKISISGTVLTLDKSGGSVTLPSSGGGDNWGTQTVATDASLSGNGTTATPLKITDNGVNSSKITDGSIVSADIANSSITTDKINAGAVTGTKIAQASATSGQALKWNGTTWAPAADETGTGIPTGPAGGDLAGTFPNPAIADGKVSTTKILDGTVAAADIANNAITTDKINAGAVTGAKIAQASATSGQALKWNGTTWAPAVDETGTGIPAGPAGGDLTGTYPNPTLGDGKVTSAKILDGTIAATDITNNAVTTDKINAGAVTGAKIAQSGATSGQVIKWNGTTWSPAVDETGIGLTLPYSGTGTSESPLFNVTNLGTSGAISTFSSGNYGIWGESGGLSGIGVYGVNKLTSGTTYGVFGDVYSSSGFSGFFQGGKFYIQGNTGIGTQNPGAKLEVAGQLKITGGSPGTGKVLTSDAAGLASWVSPTVTWLKNGNNVYYSSGNVGIGLNNPTGMMEIYGNSVDLYPTLLLSEADGYSRVSFRTMSASAKHWVLAGHTNANDGDSQFHLNFNNGTTGKNIFSVYGNSNISFDGKVGIGTTAPGSLLQVHSNITYVNNVTPIIKISDNFKTWNIGLGDPGDRFSISSEENIDRLTILKSNGFVGLGTTAPSAKLEVAGQVKITGGNPGSGKILTSDGSGLASWATPSVTWLKNGADIYYNTGRVAIGMTFPRYELTIYQDNDPHIGFYNSTSGTSGTDGFTISTGSTGSPVWIWNWENSNMHFGTNNVNRLIINADGHISMLKYLDLNTDGIFGALYVKGKQALWSDGTYFSWGYDAEWNYFADRISIGRAVDPGGYMLYVQGTAYATGSWNSSDIHFKKNITSIENALSGILRIRGTSFEFRKDEFKDYQFDEGTQFGFIAQDLEDIFPEVVKTESNGYKAVNYNGMIPVLVEAIKEQQKIINDLKYENEHLKTNYDQVEAKLKQLKVDNEAINARLGKIEALGGYSAKR